MKKIIMLLVASAQLSFGETEIADHTATGTLPAENPHGTDVTAAVASSTEAPADVLTSSATQKVYWVAFRKDGIPGDGSKLNPYDGSTKAKFDAVLARLTVSGSSSVKTVLYVGPGVFTVTPVAQVVTSANPGGYASNIPGNFEMIGAGESATTLRAGVVSDSDMTYWVLAQIGNSGGITIKNLTIDCNTLNQTATNITIDGLEFINFYGAATQSLAQGVHVINGGTRPGDQGDTEWFGIGLHDADGGEADVTQCRIDHYQGTSWCTALCGGTSATHNVVVLNAADPYNLTGKGGTGGFQNAYSPSPNLSNNVARNCTMGVYSDVDSPHDVNISNNTFDCLYAGVMLYNQNPSATVTNITIQKNVVSQTYYPPVILGTTSPTPVNSNLSVTNNEFMVDIATAPPGSPIFSFYAAKNSQVANNTFSSVTSKESSAFSHGAFSNCEASTVGWHNNKYRSGLVMPAPAGTTNLN